LPEQSLSRIGAHSLRVRAFQSWLACLLLMACTAAFPEETDSPPEDASGWNISAWNIQISLYTKHWDPEPDHVNNQKLIGGEIVFENDYLAGLAIFDNSFGQNSQFLYMGRTWDLGDSGHWYFKLMGGLLHGYKEPYDDKIPLNQLGVAPAILPALGFRYKRVMVEANIAAVAAMTITAGVRF